jgi:hypothetical protein
MWARRSDGLVESFDVPNLKLSTLAFGQGAKGIRLTQRRGQRLFHEHWFPCPERPEPHFGVYRGRHGYRHRVTPCQERVEVRGRRRPDLSRDHGTPPSVDVIHTGKRDPIETSKVASVETAEASDPDDADSKTRAHAGTPRRE